MLVVKDVFDLWCRASALGVAVAVAIDTLTSRHCVMQSETATKVIDSLPIIACVAVDCSLFASFVAYLGEVGSGILANRFFQTFTGYWSTSV